MSLIVVVRTGDLKKEDWVSKFFIEVEIWRSWIWVPRVCLICLIWSFSSNGVSVLIDKRAL